MDAAHLSKTKNPLFLAFGAVAAIQGRQKSIKRVFFMGRPRVFGVIMLSFLFFWEN